jgi:hypothetical protein
LEMTELNDKDKRRRRRLTRKYEAHRAYHNRPYMVVVHDPFSPEITPTQARSCYQKLTTALPAQLFQRPIGEARRCFANVRGVVQRYGGSEVLGWLVSETATVGPNRNRLAKCEAIAHAVWQTPTGELVEVTPGHECHRFYFDADAPRTNCTIYFQDSLDIAQQWFSGESEVLRVQLVSATSDHRIDKGVIRYGIISQHMGVQVARSWSSWRQQ